MMIWYLYAHTLNERFIIFETHKFQKNVATLHWVLVMWRTMLKLHPSFFKKKKKISEYAFILIYINFSVTDIMLSKSITVFFYKIIEVSWYLYAPTLNERSITFEIHKFQKKVVTLHWVLVLWGTVLELQPSPLKKKKKSEYASVLIYINFSVTDIMFSINVAFCF